MSAELLMETSTLIEGNPAPGLPAVSAHFLARTALPRATAVALGVHPQRNNAGEDARRGCRAGLRFGSLGKTEAAHEIRQCDRWPFDCRMVMTRWHALADLSWRNAAKHAQGAMKTV